MNLFAKKAAAPAQPAGAQFMGADAIRDMELTLAREDVSRLKVRAEDAGVELAVVTDKLNRVRAFERDLLASEAAILSKRGTIDRMLKVKERVLLELEQDAR
ncbi:MAG: hypothetical protein AAAC47_01765 [Pararhizobium sp.]